MLVVALVIVLVIAIADGVGGNCKKSLTVLVRLGEGFLAWPPLTRQFIAGTDVGCNQTFHHPARGFARYAMLELSQGF